ncbi:hypothetical protein BYT27DRAFT_7180408 [Phlegmacium glaucopus]|nr:hypothetical protein BYT27DRAFT_7180408 [Phlegmacium glaucopus]
MVLLSRFTELFTTTPRVHRAMLASFVVMIAQQMSFPAVWGNCFLCIKAKSSNGLKCRK